MKKVFTGILLISLLLFFVSCDIQNKNNPRNQSMTKWEAENITIYIVDANNGFIEFEYDGNICALYFGFALYNRITAYPQDNYYLPENAVVSEEEVWKLKHMKKDSFTAEVESTTYFEEGQELKFKKVADNIDESEIPYPPEQEDEQ